jgi:hypothetical protein
VTKSSFSSTFIVASCVIILKYWNALSILMARRPRSFHFQLPSLIKSHQLQQSEMRLQDEAPISPSAWPSPHFEELTESFDKSAQLNNILPSAKMTMTLESDPELFEALGLEGQIDASQGGFVDSFDQALISFLAYLFINFFS